jgi:DNA-directed RNA polymerase specialized sigma24 family protein
VPLETFTVASPAAAGEAGKAPQPLASSRTALLAIFDSNQDRAEEKYHQLYEKLVRYFAWNRSSEPEDMAQEALKRGLTRLREGKQITAENPESYFFGIARNIVRESWNALKEKPYLGQVQERDLPLFCNLNRGEQVVFLKECLRGLSRDDVEMLIAYLQGNGKTWAREAGLRLSTLRSRVHRARKRLELLAKELKSCPGGSSYDPRKGRKSVKTKPGGL